MAINLRSRGKKNLRLSLDVFTTSVSGKMERARGQGVRGTFFEEHHVEISMDVLVSNVIWKDFHDWEVRFERKHTE